MWHNEITIAQEESGSHLLTPLCYSVLEKEIDIHIRNEWVSTAKPQFLFDGLVKL
jgi:hypothetical protein